MPQIAEIRKIDGALWARVDMSLGGQSVQLLSEAEIQENRSREMKYLDEIERVRSELSRLLDQNTELRQEIVRLMAALKPFAEPHAMGDNYVQFAPRLIKAAREALDGISQQQTTGSRTDEDRKGRGLPGSIDDPNVRDYR